METKCFEVRDRGTFIPVIATKVNSAIPGAERFLMRRSGFQVNDEHVIIINLVDFRTCYSPYDWNSTRTMKHAHIHIQDNFDKLLPGAVIDVEYILGETDKPRESELYE